MKTKMNQIVNVLEVSQSDDRNYREHTEERYQIKEMIEDLLVRGQTTAVALEKVEVGGKTELQVLKGNRRIKGLTWLATNKDVNGQPFIDPTTGKPFGPVKADIYSDLTYVERVMLKFDHGTAVELNELELFYAFCDAFNAGIGWKEIIRISRQLLDRHHPYRGEEAKKPTTDEGWLNYHKGTLQTQKLGYDAPDILRAEFERKLSGKQKWPTNKEMAELVKAYDTERGNDPTNSINKKNPGPEFLATFNNYVTEKKKQVANGNAPKPLSMMNRQELEEVVKGFQSRMFKGLTQFQFRKAPRERLGEFDAMQAAFENICFNGGTVTKEQAQQWSDLYIALVGGGAPKPATETPETPATDAK